MVLHAHVSHGGWTIGLLVAAVQRHSLTPLTSSSSRIKSHCIKSSATAHLVVWLPTVRATQVHFSLMFSVYVKEFWKLFVTVNRVGKAAEQGTWTPFGYCNKCHMWRKISFCKFLIAGEDRLITQNYVKRSFLMKRTNLPVHWKQYGRNVHYYVSQPCGGCILLQTSKIISLQSFRIAWFS
jgi:hypothetical protein